MKKLILSAMFILICVQAQAATYYVRTDGGTATQCTGLADAAYDGSGTGEACAFIHPFWAIAVPGNSTKMVGGDTLIIDGASSAKYMMGYGAPNTTSCSYSYPWDCWMRAIPSGTVATPTRILGKGYDSGCAAPPQLWGTERADFILNLRASNNVEVQCLEVTDHSSCQLFGPNACQRTTYPFGQWAVTGITAYDSSNVLIKNVNIHGLYRGVFAGRLNNWTIQSSKFNTNSFVGWDGDLGKDGNNVQINSSNSGTMRFTSSEIKYSGCGETYPGLVPYDCYSQDQGGYGDGLGTQATGGDWIFDTVDISRNVSDGIDLLYHNGNGTVTVTNSNIKQNTGNQIKTATTTTISGSAIDGNCAYLYDNSLVYSPSTFNSCRAAGDAAVFTFRSGKQIRITNTPFTNVRGSDAIISAGSACNGTELLGVDTATTFQLLATFLDPNKTAQRYYASGAGGNGDGPCGTLTITTIPSSCTSDNSCSAATPACGQQTSGFDNCGNPCSKVGAACPQCVPNGSCTASTPGCGQTTTGVNNCGGVCTRTGTACTTCTPTVGVCSAPTPSCGQTTTGIDTCGGSCTKTGTACCVPDGTCTASTPSCGATTSGVDNCGTVCTRIGAPCCVPNSTCSAPAPACNQTTTGLNNCGGVCTKTGPACCVSNTTCSATTPLCGQTTIGVDNCGVPCSRVGASCPGAITYSLSWNQFRRQSLYYTSQVNNNHIVYILGYNSGDFQIVKYKAITVPAPTKVYRIAMDEFKRRSKFYTTEILAGNKVYVLNYNGNSYEFIKKP